MKAPKLFFALIATFYALTVSAYDAVIDGIYYNFDGSEAGVTGNPDIYSGDVVIPSSVIYNSTTYTVTSIGAEAFYDCIDLTSVTIPNSVTYIGPHAFENCTSLKNVNIPENVTNIGEYTFVSCSSLTSITIPNSVTSIGVGAFYNCSGLSSITIPEGVTSIGDYSFYGCSLTAVTIPNSVTSLGEGAFQSCSNLTSITIPNSVTSIGSSAFSGTSWYNNQPDGLVYAGKVAYKYKGTMPEGTHITIEDGTLEIANSAFRDCSGLASITIPNSVSNISNHAFYGCSGLKTVTIPNSVTSIGEDAFYGCCCLKDFYSLAEIVPSTAANVFNNSGIDVITLHVPAASVETYKAATPWNGFGRIVAIGEEVPSETVEIATAEDLANFAARVNAGETSLGATLKADIDFTAYHDVMIGTYQGEFDGVGHSIGLALNRSSNNAGLFSFLSNGYVHDLIITGTITTSAQFAGGIAAIAKKATIERCQSRVNIISTVNGDGTHGSIVGISQIGTVISDCLVSGSISGSQTNSCGGVSGWADGITFISNCLITGDITVSTTNSDLLARNSSNVISTNNYFHGEWNASNSCENVVILSTSQVTSGEACLLLNNVRTGDEMVWYQTLGEDDYPVPDNRHMPVWYSNGIYSNEIPITIGSTGYATYCSRYPLDFSEVSGMKAYIASGFSPSTGKLVLTNVTEVPAGEGLYLVGEAGTYEVATAETDMMYSNLLKGVTTATTISPTDGSYTNFILANGIHGVAFYSLSAAGELAAGKAYLQLPTASVSEVKAISVIFDDDEDAVLNIKEESQTQRIYNLQGQQVNAPKNGLYIINGKKIFIK